MRFSNSAVLLWEGSLDGHPMYRSGEHNGQWPSGWTKKVYLRTKGKTKGRRDSYWFTPEKHFRLRSMSEVDRYMSQLRRFNGDEEMAMKHHRDEKNSVKPVGIEKPVSISPVNPSLARSDRWDTAGVHDVAKLLYKATGSLARDISKDFGSWVNPRRICKGSMKNLLEEITLDVVELVAVPPICSFHKQQFADKANQELVDDVVQNLQNVDYYRDIVGSHSKLCDLHGSPQSSARIDKVKSSFQQIQDLVHGLACLVASSVTEAYPTGNCTALSTTFRILRDMDVYYTRHLVYDIIEGLVSKFTGCHDSQKLERLTDDAIFRRKWGCISMKRQHSSFDRLLAEDKGLVVSGASDSPPAAETVPSTTLP